MLHKNAQGWSDESRNSIDYVAYHLFQIKSISIWGEENNKSVIHRKTIWGF